MRNKIQHQYDLILRREIFFSYYKIANIHKMYANIFHVKFNGKKVSSNRKRDKLYTLYKKNIPANVLMQVISSVINVRVHVFYKCVRNCVV